MQKRIFSTAPRPLQAKQAVQFSRHAGFTIIELMVSLVLLAVAAALSLPSYRDMIEKRQLTHGAEQIMAFVNSAQLEATQRNDFITISWSRTADNNWCFGTAVGEAACDCNETVPAETDYCAINATPSVISNLNVGSRDLLKSISGDANYTYDPIRGIFDDFGDDLNIELSSDSQSYQLTLVMNRTGQATLCSKDNNHKVPGYSVCAVPEIVDA